jgi:hypothetical protein
MDASLIWSDAIVYSLSLINVTLYNLTLNNIPLIYFSFDLNTEYNLRFSINFDRILFTNILSYYTSRTSELSLISIVSN